jgi:hypothetical protein
MAALKQRLTRLEDLIDALPASPCPSCHGFGHPRRFVKPFIGDTIKDWRFGDTELVPDDRLDADGSCVVCGAPSALPSVVELGLPPDLKHLLRRPVE